ncbi:MAG: twin-arginine translocation signal domain-containing protein, partial [Rhodopila sp.]
MIKRIQGRESRQGRPVRAPLPRAAGGPSARPLQVSPTTPIAELHAIRHIVSVGHAGGSVHAISLNRRNFLRGSAASGALLTCSVPLDRPAHAASVRIEAPVIEQLTVREIIDNSHDIFLAGAKYAGLSVQRTGFPQAPQGKTLESEWGLALHLESRKGAETRRYLLDFGFTPDVYANNLDLRCAVSSCPSSLPLLLRNPLDAPPLLLRNPLDAPRSRCTLPRFRGFAPEKSIFARMAPGKPLIIRGYMERMRAKPAVVKTYPVPAGSFRSLDSPRHVFTADPAKDGKTHSYWSVVENQRLDGGRVVQRPVLYLGEINSSQAAVWRKAIEVLDEDAGRPQTLALFPEDRCDAIASDAS